MGIPEEFRDNRTQAEKDKSTAASYWLYAVEYGIHYYIAGRYSMFARLTPAAANQLHHAVELLLKACLALSDSWQQILKYGHSYGHDLEELWIEFKTRNPDPALAAHDDVIKELNKFEDIRYPEQLIAGGAMVSMGVHEVLPEHRTRPADLPEGLLTTPENRRFFLELPRVDRLVHALFNACHYNPEVLAVLREPRAREYLWLHNTAPPLPEPTSEEPTGTAPPAANT
jgi:hypothetical protein